MRVGGASRSATLRSATLSLVQSQPLTLTELIDALVRFRSENPDYAVRPVHILDMDEERADPVRGGLVTCVEADCFSEEQGPVTSVMSWPNSGR